MFVLARREASPIIHPLNCLLDSHDEDGNGEKNRENEGDERAKSSNKNSQKLSMKYLARKEDKQNANCWT